MNDGVSRVSLEIGEIVHEIDRARQHAEDHECRPRSQERRDVIQPLCEDQRRENHEVLGPLLWA